MTKKKTAKPTPKKQAKPTPKTQAKPAAKKPQARERRQTMTHPQATAAERDHAAELDQTEREQMEQFEAAEDGELKPESYTEKMLADMDAPELRELASDLAAEVIRLRAVEDKHRELVAELEVAAGVDDRRRYVRGKLPGGKLIKTDSHTGAFEVVDQEEWDLLPVSR